MTLALALGTLANPTPPAPLSGHFAFWGKVELLGSLSIERIRNAGTPEGAERLRELKSVGFDCKPVPEQDQSYVCEYPFDATSLPPALEKKIAENWARVLDVRAIAAPQSETLLSDADNVTRWSVAQTMRVNGRQYLSYKITEEPGETRFSFSPTPSDPSRDLVFAMLRDGNLQYVTTATENVDPNSTDRQILYFAGLTLERSVP